MYLCHIFFLAFKIVHYKIYIVGMGNGILDWSTFCFLIACRFPLYYEVKIGFVIWLLSPYTRGASLLYRKFLHPLLSKNEKVSCNLLGRESVHGFFAGHKYNFLLRGAVLMALTELVIRTKSSCLTLSKTSCRPSSFLAARR